MNKTSVMVNTVESQLQAKVGAIATCATEHGFDSGTSLPAKYNTAEQAYNSAVAALALSEQDKGTKCSTRDTNCGQRDDHGRTLYSLVRGSTQCALPQQPASTTVYDETFVLNDVDQWTESVEAQHIKWKQFKDVCNSNTATCATADAHLSANLTAKTGKCSELDQAKASGQNAYDGCYYLAEGKLKGYDWQAEVTAQKNSIESVETLICYVKVAVKDMEGGGNVRKDGAIACEDVGGGSTAQYKCTCTSNNAQEYQRTYDTSVTVPTVPAKDAAWDTKGCPDSNSAQQQ